LSASLKFEGLMVEDSVSVAPEYEAGFLPNEVVEGLAVCKRDIKELFGKSGSSTETIERSSPFHMSPH